MSRIAPFVFNVLRARAVDPANTRFFLPTVLAAAGGDNSRGKLLPIEADSWPLGAIRGAEGTTLTRSLATQWATYLEKVKHVGLSGQHVIGRPDDPWPKVTLGTGGQADIVVEGLQNLFVEKGAAFDTTGDGYRVRFTLDVGYWDGHDGRPRPAPLTLSAPYSIHQALCQADATSGTCNGRGSMDIDGGGKMAVTITGAVIDVTASLGVAPDASRPSVVVEHLTLRGPGGTGLPRLDVAELTIDARVSKYLLGIWESMATEAITSTDGCRAIVDNINAALGAKANLDILSDRMTRQLASAVDGVFVTTRRAPTGPSTGANPLDRYLFDRVRAALDAPESPFFLPQVACQVDDPPLSPLRVGTIDLPPIDIASMRWTDGKLSDVVVTGLTNVRADPSRLSLGPDAVTFAVDLGGWATPPKASCAIPPPPITATAGFSIRPPDSDEHQLVTGTLRLAIRSAEVQGQCSATGVSEADAGVSFESLKIVVGDPSESLKVELDIDSAFKGLINQAINTPNVLQIMLDGLNAQLQAHLPDIGAQVTTALRTALKKGLG